MLRLLTYLLFAFTLFIFASCSNSSIDNLAEPDNSNNANSNSEIISINNRITNSVGENNTDTSLAYRAKVNRNVGSFVNHSIQEIPLITEDIERNKTQFKISQTVKTEIYTSPTIINVVFDNDIFNNTDYYYTNGVNIELTIPFAKQSPLSKLLVGSSGSQIDLYGFSIKQNIYTPTNPDIEEISVGDRPFSAFLTLGHYRESYHIQKKLSIVSSINFGVIGPASMGGVVQSTIHDIEPIGWDNQISNNFVIDYSLKLEKGIISTPHLELNLTAGGNIGTIFNKINGGVYLRTGSFIPVFRGPSTVVGNTSINNNIQYWFFLCGETNLVFYDATLQGGIFRNNNAYTLHGEDINRFVINLSAGMAMYYHKVGVELHSFYLSPEFKNAYDFRWGRIKLVFQL